MKNYRLSVITLAFCFALVGAIAWPAKCAYAQLGAVSSVSRTPDGLRVTLGQDMLSVRVCTADMIEVHYQPNGTSTPQTPCITATNWTPVAFKLSADADPIVISTAAMTVAISRAPCRIAVYDTAKRLLVKEQDAGGVSPGGLNLTGADGSHFFGIHGWEFLDKAGSQEELFPRPAPYAIRAGAEGNTGAPFVWSNQGYGVYVDTVGGQCEISDGNSIEFSGLSRPDVDYYVMVGNAYTLHTRLDQLTGLPPMFPKWALGLFNSEFAGIHESDMRAIVAGYRSRGIPFDTYVNDFDWKDWSGDNYGEWHWNPVKFPDGASGQLKRDMDAQGIKIVGIMKPRIHVNTVQGRYATDHGFWVKKPFYTDYFDHGQVGDLDFSIPACRQWFWDHAEDAFDTGIVGWWNDEADAWGDNLAFMYMAQAEYQGQRGYTHDGQRVYTINRNFYSGSQRYAYATWSGDIDSGFAVMQDQRARLLASLNVGQAKWGMDTGGFNNSNHVTGQEASECYARWMEFDAFVPIFRLHGTSRRQPWLYGPVAEAAATKAIKLRYSLLPYLYASDRTLNQTGIGICRPLIWDYPNDPNCVNDVDSWMFGDYLLASPVVDENQSVKPIYLPAGTWTDYFRGAVYQGPQTVAYPVNAATWDDIPLFIKSGAIIPTIKVMDYVGQRPVREVSLDIFPSAAQTGFTYYDDDGISYGYEHGAFFSQAMTVRANLDSTVFSITRKTGTYTPPLQYYFCKIHGHSADSVQVNDRAISHAPGLADLETLPSEGWATGRDLYGDVTWVKVAAGIARQVVLHQAQPSALAKTFIDYFRPMPIVGSLMSNVWGAPTVGPRDPKNGLEDAAMTKWDYWDGKIIQAKDGKYHMFASRWDQANGHNGWFGSQAVHAVSDHLTGPYIDTGLCWPDNEGGKGHNVTALTLPDGRYAVVVSETRPGDVFVSKSLDGPWDYLGRIQVAPGEFSGEGRMSNVSIMVRPDGGFEIVPRSGAILISKTGILGPYTVQGPSIYPNVVGLPQDNRGDLEDPVIWFSGGLYHLLVNNWSDRKAYHLTSVNGITDWTYQGLAYDPTTDFARYTDGTINHWNKMERPNVYLENGHVAAVTLAVIDVPKEDEHGNDNHGSKVIVIPFNGAALDRDLQRASAASSR